MQIPSYCIKCYAWPCKCNMPYVPAPITNNHYSFPLGPQQIERMISALERIANILESKPKAEDAR